MKQPITCRPGSDELDALMHAKIDAGRVNDILANPASKRHGEYLDLLRRQASGEHVLDPRRQYSEQNAEQRALAIGEYQRHIGQHLATGLIFQHDDFPLIAAPDAVGDGGYTFHLRTSPDTFWSAVERGVDRAMLNHAQAMMLVSGLRQWTHVDVLAPDLPMATMYGHAVERNEYLASSIEAALIGFALKSRLARSPKRQRADHLEG